MDVKALQDLLQMVKQGEITIDEAVSKLRHLPSEDLGYARIDHHRGIRCGFPEVIYCPGKTGQQIMGIFESLARGGNNVLATRAEKQVFDMLASDGRFPGVRYEALARMIVLEQKGIEPSDGFIAIVTAGTADMPVAAEADVTARLMGQRTRTIYDVGVAGLHRLFDHMAVIQQANVIIVVAGMEGALASVIGGMVSCPVIAVPTSVGYGASFDGLSALLTMLNSCAGGVTVVNIDNGFGAALSASLINRQITGRSSK